VSWKTCSIVEGVASALSFTISFLATLSFPRYSHICGHTRFHHRFAFSSSTNTMISVNHILQIHRASIKSSGHNGVGGGMAESPDELSLVYRNFIISVS